VTREQIFGEQSSLRTCSKRRRSHAAPFKSHSTLGESTNLSNRREEVATFETDDGAHDRRVRVVAETRDQVLDASDPVLRRSQRSDGAEC